jgi:hypothetical protein
VVVVRGIWLNYRCKGPRARKRHARGATVNLISAHVIPALALGRSKG